MRPACMGLPQRCCGVGIVLTNDGHAILREIDVSHPAAKVTHEAEMLLLTSPFGPTHTKNQHVLLPAVHDPAQQDARRGGWRWHNFRDHFE